MAFIHSAHEVYRQQTLTRPEAFQRIINGNTFINSLVASGLTAGSTALYGFFTGNKPPTVSSLTFSADVGPMTIIMYEASTITAAGTVNPSYNLNRNSNVVEDTVITISPTASANGTAIWGRFYQAGNGRSGTEGSAEMGIILKPNTSYLFTVTNNSATPDSHSIEWVFSE